MTADTPAPSPAGDAAVSGPNYQQVETSKLLLDHKNPRLSLPDGSEQKDILRLLYESESLSDLAHSIAASGFFPEEPLVVIPAQEPQGHYVVVEGNRRLATIRLLLDPELRAQLKLSGWPALEAARAASLQSVPCVVRATREEVEAFLVFRHITGIKKWDSFQKARYVTGLIDRGLSIDDIEKRIGDDVGTIKKLYQSFLVYRHVRDDLSMDTKPLLQSFSLIEVALGQRPIKKFIGLPHRLSSERAESIVPDTNLDQLRELITWIFGDSNSGRSPVIRDSRDINQKLSPTIANPASLEYLRATGDLDEAYQRSLSELEYLNSQLLAAERALKRAVGEASQFKGDAGVKDQVGKLLRLVQSLLEIVE